MSWALLLLTVLPATTPAADTPKWFAPSSLQFRDVEVGDVVRLQRGPGLGAGGEFVMFNTRLERRADPMRPVPAGDVAAATPECETSANGDAGPNIVRLRGTSLLDTFSVEIDQPLLLGQDYTVTRIGRTAYGGGHGGSVPKGGDPIDPRTAYLYERFFFRNLSNYHYDQYEVPRATAAKPTGLRNPDADQLQQAIWFLENELPAIDPATGKSLGYQYDPTDLKIAAKTLGETSAAYRWIAEADEAVRGKDPAKIIGSRVRVATLRDRDRCDVQDVLVVLMPELGQVPVTVPLASGGYAVSGLRGAAPMVGGFGGGYG